MTLKRQAKRPRRSIFDIHSDRAPSTPFLPFDKKPKSPPTEIRSNGTSTTNETSPKDTGVGATGP